MKNSKHKDFFEDAISRLNRKQKKKLETLVAKLDNAGAKDPLPWAYSEVTENIPQLGRFLVLKQLHKLFMDTEMSNEFARDFDDNYNKNYNEIIEVIGTERLAKFLQTFSKGMIFRIIDLLDNGNENIKSDEISWALVQTDKDYNPTGQIIGGLHESFIDFNI